MAIPLIWGAISAITFIGSWIWYESQEAEMDAILQEFKDILDHLIITDPMTYGQFMEAGGWIFILGGFILLLVFLLIAFPGPKKDKKKGGRK